MPHQNLNSELIIAISIWFMVMFLFAIILIAGLGSILSEHRTKIVSKLKTGFNSVVAKFQLKNKTKNPTNLGVP